MGDIELHPDHIAWNIGSLGLGPSPIDLRPASLSCPDTPLEIHARDTGVDYLGAPKPANDVERVKHLYTLNILDSPTDARYDSITHFIAKRLAIPICSFNQIDHDRSWCKSMAGLGEVREGPRTFSAMCSFQMLPADPEMLCSTKLHQDPRFMNNPYICGEPYLRSYLGCPLVCSNGLRFGTLCVIDYVVRYWTVEDCCFLANFAELASREVEAEALANQLCSNPLLRPSRVMDRGVLLIERGVTAPRDWRILYASSRALDLLGQPSSSLLDSNFWHVVTLTMEAATSEFDACMDALADFAFFAAAFGEDGRKVRLSCQARVATAPLDDMMPVQMPMDVVSEESPLNSLWFITISHVGSCSMAYSGVGCARRSPESLLAQLASPVEAGADGLRLLRSGTIFLSRGGGNGTHRVAFANDLAACLWNRPSSAMLGQTFASAFHQPRCVSPPGNWSDMLNGSKDFTFTAVVIRDGDGKGTTVDVVAEQCEGLQRELPKRSTHVNGHRHHGWFQHEDEPYVWCLKITPVREADCTCSVGVASRHCACGFGERGDLARANGRLQEGAFAPMQPPCSWGASRHGMILGHEVVRHLHGLVNHTVSEDKGTAARGLCHLVQVPEASWKEEGGSYDMCERLYHRSVVVDNRPDLEGAVLRTTDANVPLSFTAVTIFKELNGVCLGSLRCLIHGNVFKAERGLQDLMNGVVAIDYKKVLTVLVGVADALSRIHQMEAAHGELTDLTVLMLAPKEATDVPKPVLFSVGMDSECVTNLEDVLNLRDDYLLFFAPERYEGLYKQPLSAPTTAADVWSLGVLALMMASFSLPVLELGASDVLKLARSGKLAMAVFDEAAAKAPPDFMALAESCLCPDPQLRPSALQVRQGALRLLQAPLAVPEQSREARGSVHMRAGSCLGSR